MDEEEWEVAFACNDTYLRLFPGWAWPRESINSIDPRLFMTRLAKGARLYPLSTLRQYVREDLQLLERVKPDVIVGDFRLSLSVSARVTGIPYVALSNAYWSPYASRRHIPMPSLPMARILGVPLASAFFVLGRPFAFAWHAVPLNLLRRQYGLPSLGLDLRRVYTDADMTLYADVPELVPTSDLPENHRYIGPVEWSPDLPMPTLPAAASGRPLVYVTLGSSGSGALLPVILEALSTVDCHVAVAAAGARLEHVPANVTVADYLPGAQMSAHANLVICNGGSPTSHQAFACGVPVLGIPFNLDQHLNMDCVVAYGAGLALRPEHADVRALRGHIQQLLSEPEYRRRAAALRCSFGMRHAAEGFRQALDAAISGHKKSALAGA